MKVKTEVSKAMTQETAERMAFFMFNLQRGRGKEDVP